MRKKEGNILRTSRSRSADLWRVRRRFASRSVDVWTYLRKGARVPRAPPPIEWQRSRGSRHRRRASRRSPWGSGRRDTCRLGEPQVHKRRKRRDLSQVSRGRTLEGYSLSLSLSPDHLTFFGDQPIAVEGEENLEAARIIEHSRRTQMPRRKQHAPQRMKCELRQSYKISPRRWKSGRSSTRSGSDEAKRTVSRFESSEEKRRISVLIVADGLDRLKNSLVAWIFEFRSSSFAKFSAREKGTERHSRVKFDREAGVPPSLIRRASSTEPRGTPRGMRRDFGSNRGEFRARDYPRLFSAGVINYFPRAVLNVRTFDASTKIRAVHDCIVVRWSSSCIKRRHARIKFSTRTRPAIYCISAACVYGLIKTKETSRRS